MFGCATKSPAPYGRLGLCGLVVGLVAALLTTASPALAVAGYGDVAEGKFYADAVQWSVDSNIAVIAGSCFLPDEPVTRGEAAVYFWNMENRPTAPAHSFVDITDDSQDDAVSWMSHAEITTGTSVSTFSPEKTLTRAQVAAFLHRLSDLPTAPAHSFVDVAADWQQDAVSWMSHNKITTGTSPTTFSPDRTLNRSEVITFLYRYKGSPAVSVDSSTPTCDPEAQQPTTAGEGPPLVAIESSAPLVVDGSFDVTISFDKSVTGLSLADLIVVNGRAASLAGDGAEYTATIEPADDGTVMVRVPPAAASGIDGAPNEASAPFVRTNTPRASAAARGIDTWNRPLVLSAYSSEFDREEPDWEYTGNVDDCVAGTTGQAFRESVIQRGNWYRQMAGLDTVTENPTLSATAQSTALMMVAQGALSHFPDSDWACYSPEGAESAGKSNLGLGNAGVAGIDAYMRDSGDNNRRVGHRRWILYPHTREMGTGNARKPGPHYVRTANAQDVISGDRLSNRPIVREVRGFVSWPPAGYVPPSVVWGRWSFSLPEADFSGVSVMVADDSGATPVEILDREATVGEPGIVWAVADDTNSNLLPTPTDGDHCYTVTVKGVRIEGETQAPYEYPVCVIDPNAPSGPSVTLDPLSSDAVGGSFDVTISFSEPVEGFTQSDIFVVNGTVTALSGWGRDYSATIEADDNGTVVVTVGAGAVHDKRKRPNSAAIPLHRTANVGRSAVSVSSAGPATSPGGFDVDIEFSEPVTDFTLSGIRVVNGTVSDLTGTDASYRATVMPDTDGAVMVRILQDAATSATGRGNRSSVPFARLQSVDTSPGPGVDTWDRATVVDSYTAEFDRDEPDWGYTGDVDNCVAGTTSQRFRSSVLQRLNWYREMAGLDPAGENTAHSAAAQQAALIYLANGSFSITTGSKCYTPTGASAANEGPGWLGTAGLDVIDQFIRDERFHLRKNVLAPALAEVGIGHARDPSSRYRVAHMLYTRYDNPWNYRDPVRERRGFVSWPPSGYAPAVAVDHEWSFSLADADFSAAAIEMADHSGLLEIKILGTDSWYREQTISWSVGEADLAERQGPTDADHCFSVNISSVTINGAAQAPYEYAVCVLDLDS